MGITLSAGKDILQQQQQQMHTKQQQHMQIMKIIRTSLMIRISVIVVRIWRVVYPDLCASLRRRRNKGRRCLVCTSLLQRVFSY